jgi:hypothetical protein
LKTNTIRRHRATVHADQTTLPVERGTTRITKLDEKEMAKRYERKQRLWHPLDAIWEDSIGAKIRGIQGGRVKVLEVLDLHYQAD